MKVFLGADHRGYFLKEKIAKWLFDHSYQFADLGAESLDLTDDYPVYAERVASMVADDHSARGILLCGSGIGVDVVANKFDGVRSGMGMNANQVQQSRQDDNINVLVIAADYIHEAEAVEMVKAFLETKYESTTKHKRRLEDIKRIEENN